ncbi:MAG: methyltransferase [Candidatus Woesearchaeota archaeon]
MQPTFYEPSDDSFLFSETLKQHIYPEVKHILDVGVGSGILTQILQQMYPLAQVDGIDINEDALAYAKNHTSPHITYFQSDLFEKVTDTYDLIVCNPPYLPKHHLDPDDMLTKALVGGKKGYEYTLKLLQTAKDYLTENGKILLLLTSLSQPDYVLLQAQKLLYEYKLLQKKRVGLMEDLFIYEFTRLHELSQLEHMGVTHITYDTKGKRSIVVQGMYQKKKIVCKIQTRAELHTIHKEVENLKKVNALGIGPKYITHTKSCVILEYIEGKTLKEYMKSTESLEAKKRLIRNILDELRVLDVHNLEKTELKNPYKHILIQSPENFRQIDFERMKTRKNPQNVTQFFQFIMHSKLIPTVSPNHVTLKNKLQQYKEYQTDKNFQELISLLN